MSFLSTSCKIFHFSFLAMSKNRVLAMSFLAMYGHQTDDYIDSLSPAYLNLYLPPWAWPGTSRSFKPPSSSLATHLWPPDATLFVWRSMKNVFSNCKMHKFQCKYNTILHIKTTKIQSIDFHFNWEFISSVLGFISWFLSAVIYVCPEFWNFASNSEFESKVCNMRETQKSRDKSQNWRNKFPIEMEIYWLDFCVFDVQ
jgi:hypothetical protein